MFDSIYTMQWLFKYRYLFSPIADNLVSNIKKKEIIFNFRKINKYQRENQINNDFK